MYYINKIVGFVVSPIGIAIFGGLLAMLCAKREYRRAAKWLGWLTVVWLWLWMTPAMTWIVGVPLEREFLVDGKVPMAESFQDAGVIVLLGGGMGGDTNLSRYAEMSAGADRVWQAARLYKAGKATKIIATGNHAVDTTLPLLVDFGVAKDDVGFLDARNTEEEAKGIAKKEVQKILLVTSAWHMKRARLMFEKYAPEIEVVCAPADFENSVTAAKGFLLMPDPYVFCLNSAALREWVGIAGYMIFR